MWNDASERMRHPSRRTSETPSEAKPATRSLVLLKFTFVSNRLNNEFLICHLNKFQV